MRTQRKEFSLIGGGTTYYDAAATDIYRDFTNYLGGSEDHYFDSRTRGIAIARFRREVRNNPYLAGLYETYPGALGYGKCRARTTEREFNARLDGYWSGYAREVTSQGDSLRALTLLRHAELLVAGEIFLVKLRNGRVQVIPSEYCGSPLKPTNPNELNGIGYNNAGRPLYYRFGKMQKTGVVEFGEGKSEMVEARHVIHDFRRDRVQMGRGIPDLISSLAPARDLYEITTSKTKQVKDASRIIGWITSDNGPDALEKLGYNEAQDMPTEESGTSPDTAVSDRPAEELKKIQLKDGTFPQLDLGEKLEFLEQKYDAKDYKELIYIMLHAVAAPVGLPVELWFSGLGEVNYSGFKGLGTQWHRRRRELIEDCEERLLDPLHKWRMEKSFEEGDIEMPDDVSTQALQPLAHRWAWQRTAVLDEERDAKTNETKLRTGEVSLTDVWEQNGLDPDEEFDKRRHEYIKLRIASGDLAPDVDPTTVKVPYEYLLTGELPKFRRQQGAATTVVQSPEDT